MFETITRIARWISIPVLLIASMFSRFAASYELLVDVVICLGAIIFVQRAVQSKEYWRAAGFLLVATVFSPFLLVVKIFLLMSFTYTATSVVLFMAFRKQPLPAWHP